MASVISASTTSATALNMSADTTGVLQLATGATPTTAVTIDTSQNVGIGTTSPFSAAGYKSLTINGSTTGILAIQANGSNSCYLYSDGSAFNIKGVQNIPMDFYTNDTQRMRIDSSGGVLIGTTTNTPGYKLYVKGGDGNQLILDNAGSTYTTMNYYNNGTNKLTSFWDNTTPRYYVVPAAGGGVYLAAGGTSWTASSDERVKDIIEPITDAANKVSTLRAVIGKYKTDEEGTRRAFLIAQDVHQVFPEAVDTANENEYGLRYQDTIPLLVAAIQEQQTIIQDLKARIETLEAK